MVCVSSFSQAVLRAIDLSKLKGRAMFWRSAVALRLFEFHSDIQ